ncbi:hypothetical protein [Sphingomonas abaci]|uniref:Uncharacterized protein n=1 Tax=Sphingomonas abaci TaxID=237611 RepID=A0A7W7AKN1_9SPHN|nr:hypothetical protein [Sphingomonas abaci]MBB4617984.1 hypothetical protein [Sphingomonas abaci]
MMYDPPRPGRAARARQVALLVVIAIITIPFAMLAILGSVAGDRR